MTNHGRTYLTMLSDSELVRIALDRDHELAIVLAERLSELLDVEDQLEDAKKEIVELNARLDSWMEQANTLHAQLEAQ
jgi:hypothetical protein